ncbi:hypothetical protein QBC35DRAFT_266102 [Podospora australis]|uniref:Uncharacterized protein n=1 Tax=Podospora australis TaxID=1536484 RepID=A0AAN6WSG3_9PEZI|nr:hypothetical protein QBC35DRAFT_266102 [Podospora australis]
MTLTRKTTPSPSYTSLPQNPGKESVELSHLDSTTSSPPAYDQVVPSTTFNPTTHIQIETQGKSWLSLPLPPRPVPIPVFTLNHPDESTFTNNPSFTCYRPERSSGSCYLSTNPAASVDQQVPVTSTTTYRFGPNRPPLIRMFPSGTAIPQPALQNLLYSQDNEASTTVPTAWDAFTIDSLGIFTRSIEFTSPRLKAKFQWRYASRGERKASGADSLLVLERVCGGEEVRTVVANFIRNDKHRTSGSSASSAGNGGRLMVDLRELLSLASKDGEDGARGNEKGAVDEANHLALVMVVTTCLVMLKREVDRRRAQQIAIMAGAGT